MDTGSDQRFKHTIMAWTGSPFPSMIRVDCDASASPRGGPDPEHQTIGGKSESDPQLPDQASSFRWLGAPASWPTDLNHDQIGEDPLGPDARAYMTCLPASVAEQSPKTPGSTPRCTPARSSHAKAEGQS